MPDETEITFVNVARCLELEAQVLAELKVTRAADPSATADLDPLIKHFEANCAFFEEWKTKRRKPPFSASWPPSWKPPESEV